MGGEGYRMGYEKARGFVTAVGIAFILWGLIVVISYAAGMELNGDATSTNQYHMGMSILGVAFQLLGIGFVSLAKK